MTITSTIHAAWCGQFHPDQPCLSEPADVELSLQDRHASDGGTSTMADFLQISIDGAVVDPDGLASIELAHNGRDPFKLTAQEAMHAGLHLVRMSALVHGEDPDGLTVNELHRVATWCGVTMSDLVTMRDDLRPETPPDHVN